MTLRGKLISLFPALYLTGLLALLIFGLLLERPEYLIFLPLTMYLLPVTLFRLHNFMCPLRDGDYDLSSSKYNPWWGSYMLQYPFITFPCLEGCLHMVPGLYSLWLRLWGSKIGKGVLWTPRVEVLDRSLLDIGDGVTIGHMVIMCSHAITAIEGRPILRLRTIRLGRRSFIGADSQLGPGTFVEEKSMIPVKSRLYWKGKFQGEY